MYNYAHKYRQDEREPKGPGDTKEQEEQLQKMYQKFTYKLKVDFGSNKMQSSGDQHACKKAIVFNTKKAIQHKACNIEVSIIISFDKYDWL